MTDEEINKYCDVAFENFRKELLKEHALPAMLIAVEVDKEDTKVFNICFKLVPCKEMVRVMFNAANNCQKEILSKTFQKCRLN